MCLFARAVLEKKQLTYGVVSEGVFVESLRNSAESSWKFAKNIHFNASAKVRKFCGKLRKFRGNLQKNFCNDPFLNDPTSDC